MKKLYKKLVLWMMTTRPYKWMLSHVIPYIRFTTYYTSFKGHDYHKGYKLLQPGDIILTHDRKKLTSLLIPGDLTHAALCVAKDGQWEVSEMTHEDYRTSCFFDICKEATRVVIVRCKDWDATYIREIISRCKSYKYAKYDVQFSLGVEALYCSELVYESDFERRLDVNLEDLAGLGRPYISPLGLFKAKNAVIVWDHKS